MRHPETCSNNSKISNSPLRFTLSSNFLGRKISSWHVVVDLILLLSSCTKISTFVRTQYFFLRLLFLLHSIHQMTIICQFTKKFFSFYRFLFSKANGDTKIFHFFWNRSRGNKFIAVALHSTEALMAGFLKSTDLGAHPHSYGGPHPHHHSHGPPLPPGMPMTMAPFGLPHGLDAVGFPHQGMWGKYCVQFSILIYFILCFHCGVSKWVTSLPHIPIDFFFKANLRKLG